MFNIIYCEFLKTKKSYFYLSLILVVSILPIGLTFFVNKSNFLRNGLNYIFEVEQISFKSLTIPLSVLIAVYIFTREFSFKTMSTLFCYPASKLKIFFSKLVLADLLTAGIILFQLFLVFLLGSLFNHARLTNNILLVYLKLSLYHILCLYAILPLAILIALLCKNSIIPFMYSAIVCICNLYISAFIPIANKNALGYALKSNCDYIPTYFPVKVLSNCFNVSEGKVPSIIQNAILLNNTNIIVALIVFAISTTLCYSYYCKCEVK